jgi:hypothetical protein
LLNFRGNAFRQALFYSGNDIAWNQRRIAVDLQDMTWPRVAALSKDTPVVIPIAALEQHGRHMPVFTDSMLLGEVVRRVKDSLKDRVLFTPLMWLRMSTWEDNPEQ